MNLTRELTGIVIGQLLLATVIGMWWTSVYRQEMNALKSEANVLFFKSLEEANDKLFVHRKIHERLLHEPAGGNWVSSEVPFDTVNVKQVVIMSATEGTTDTFVRQKTMEIVANIKRLMDTTDEMSMAINASASRSISFEADSMIMVDFMTTGENLAAILDSNIVHSNVPGLKFRILENPVEDSLERRSFLTNRGSLGNLFLGTNEYAAAVENYRHVVFTRMLPEIGIGMLLFLAILSAFVFVYRSLLKERRLRFVKDEFVSNITHEFKTPISVVNVALEAMQNFNVMEDKAKTKEYIDLSKSQMHRLTGMVDQVMNLSLLEDDKAFSEKERIEIGTVLDRAFESLEIQLKDKGQSVVVSVEEDGLVVLGSPSRLESVIYNLVDNASKYGSRGGDINIDLGRSAQDVIIRVSDQGPGIASEHLSSIFDKFYRIPTDNIHDVKGYGLGLYQVREIIRRHHGDITVDSVEGEGTRFTIKLPLYHE